MKQLQLVTAIPANQSLDHVSLIEGDVTTFGEKSLLQRATGRFYTHELIGRSLARAVAAQLRVPVADDLHVIDPFCGDGRLAEWLLEEAGRNAVPRWHVSLWDCDEAAVKAAAMRLRETAERMNVELALDTWVGDTFARALNPRRRYGAVLTNPPWELPL